MKDDMVVSWLDCAYQSLMAEKTINRVELDGKSFVVCESNEIVVLISVLSILTKLISETQSAIQVGAIWYRKKVGKVFRDDKKGK